MPLVGENLCQVVFAGPAHPNHDFTEPLAGLRTDAQRLIEFVDVEETALDHKRPKSGPNACVV